MRTLIVTALCLAASLAFAQERTPAPAGAEVYLIAPRDGARVHSPVLVQFGLRGMGIAPAGIKFDNTGHHHLLIDTDAPADLSAPLPASDKIVHFGKGQTETSLTPPRAGTPCSCCSRTRTTSRTARRCCRARSPSRS
jgi:hypothetical protein